LIKGDVEDAGLVKFDFLGLRTLTIIDWAVKMISAARAQAGEKPLDIMQIPLDDAPTYELLRSGETTAVFQLESRGMKELIERLQPDCFEDIVALLALFRPGPLQSGMVDNFVNRKRGREKISYPDPQYQHPSLQPILQPTYGIILYQEQVMQIAQVLAGYTLGGADVLRRAMGKKDPKEMAKQRAVFEAGANAKGVDGDLAIRIFDLVEKVRRLRLQQVALGGVRAGVLPDGVAQDALPGALHGRRDEFRTRQHRQDRGVRGRLQAHEVVAAAAGCERRPVPVYGQCERRHHLWTRGDQGAGLRAGRQYPAGAQQRRTLYLTCLIFVPAPIRARSIDERCRGDDSLRRAGLIESRALGVAGCAG
jgi:hypothetical protein